MQHLETVRRVELTAAGGGAAAVRAYAAPVGVSFTDVTVVVSSDGETLGFGGVGWEVFYGGAWAGAPFDSVLTGGVSKGSGVFLAGAEVATVVHTDTNLLPTNLEVASRGRPSEVFGAGGFPISLVLTNNTAVPLRFWVTFICRTVSLGG